MVARTLAPALERALGSTVIVDNRSGAGGAIGAAYVARAEPDGRTLLVSTPNALVVLPKMTKVLYSLSNFQPVGLATTTALVVVVKNQSRFKNISALLAYAQANPGQVTAGHAGLGTTNHVALLQLEEAAKIKLNLVPYKGSAPALVDLMGGQIDFVVDQITSSGTQIQSNTIRALAVMSTERDSMFMEVPTLRESGLIGFDATTATGLLAPAGTPVAIVEFINTALRNALNEAAVKVRLIALGSPGNASSPQDWNRMLQLEDQRAQALATAGKLKAD